MNKENTGYVNGHPINCACYSCTGGDTYLARIKSNVGKNAIFSNFDPFNGVRFAARPGVYGSNHADPIQPIQTTAPAQTVVKNGSDWGQLLGSLGLEALEIIMDKQKAGQISDPTLNKIGQTANQIAQAGVNAGISKTESTVGQNVIKFSPWIIGGILILLGTIIFLIARK